MTSLEGLAVSLPSHTLRPMQVTVTACSGPGHQEAQAIGGLSLEEATMVPSDNEDCEGGGVV